MGVSLVGAAIAVMIYVGVSAAYLANVSLSGRIALPPLDDTCLAALQSARALIYLRSSVRGREIDPLEQVNGLPHALVDRNVQRCVERQDS